MVRALGLEPRTNALKVRYRDFHALRHVAISCASGNSVCHADSRQTCLGVAATRNLTGPNSVMRSSVSESTETGESTHSEPLQSFTIVMRVVNMTPMSRTLGPSTIQIDRKSV